MTAFCSLTFFSFNWKNKVLKKPFRKPVKHIFNCNTIYSLRCVFVVTTALHALLKHSLNE